MSCVQSNFPNFVATIYYTHTKKKKKDLIFLIFCAIWVIKWENHKIKINKSLKNSSSLIHYYYYYYYYYTHLVMLICKCVSCIFFLY